MAYTPPPSLQGTNILYVRKTPKHKLITQTASAGFLVSWMSRTASTGNEQMDVQPTLVSYEPVFLKY